MRTINGLIVAAAFLVTWKEWRVCRPYSTLLPVVDTVCQSDGYEVVDTAQALREKKAALLARKEVSDIKTFCLVEESGQ